MGVPQWLCPYPGFCLKPNWKFLMQCTPGDVESFFMLFFDNFSSLLGILAGMISAPMIACQFDFTYAEYFTAFRNMVFQKVCPGIGCALLFGNIWYAIMAAKLSAKEGGRKDVTALPYGINTPAGFLTVYMVMLPICFTYSPKIADMYNDGEGKLDPDDFAERALNGACAANFIGGLFEVAGIVLGQPIRRHFPRAALFGPICGVGFVWLGLAPLIDVMREPIIGFIPLALCFTGFFAAKGRGIYPLKVPTALLIFGVGTILWWCGLARWDTEGRVDMNGDLNENNKMQEMVDMMWETTAGKNKFQPFVTLKGFSEIGARAIAIQLPIAIASFVETIENVEAAALIGDSYNVNEAMLADGLGTMFGAICGAVMPTTVYIGHKRHKATGATAMYSTVNGIVYFILMMSGLTGVLFYCIDPVSIGVILIAVGLMIVQFAMEHSASRHYPALMIGIMFVVADMIYFDHFNVAVGMATRSLGRMRGVANMAPGGGILCSIIVPAILCDLTDLRFIRASIWSLIALFFSLFGLMHGNNYVFYDGTMLHALTGFAGMEDFYTTDLGEAMLSTYTFPKYDALGYEIEQSSGWGYAIQDTDMRAFNEGWRFSIAYACVFLFCIAHAAFQKFLPGKMEPAVMDNGVAIPADEAPAPKEEATAAAYA